MFAFNKTLHLQSYECVPRLHSSNCPATASLGWSHVSNCWRLQQTQNETSAFVNVFHICVQRGIAVAMVIYRCVWVICVCNCTSIVTMRSVLGRQYLAHAICICMAMHSCSKFVGTCYQFVLCTSCCWRMPSSLALVMWCSIICDRLSCTFRA